MTGVPLYFLGASSRPPFVAAPREYRGNMCGLRVPGLDPVPGGAGDPSLVLSWFLDRYTPASRQRIYQAWHAAGSIDVLVSWPDSRAFGFSVAQFVGTCRELVGNQFRPCVFLCSKDMDQPNVGAILATALPLLSALIAAGVAPRVCIGWELSLWLSPTQVQQLIDAIAPLSAAAKIKTYVHFQSGYLAFQQPGGVTADFWHLNVGKLTGILHQRDPNEDKGSQSEYQARIVDCLQRFAGNFGFPAESGFGHPFDFIALEITAEDQFDGNCTEADGDRWGTAALTTPAVGDVRVMGSGNGQVG